MSRTRRPETVTGKPDVVAGRSGGDSSAGSRPSRWRVASSRRALLVVVALVVLLAGSGYGFWSASVAQPAPDALTALRSDARVSVVESSCFDFTPRTATPNAGLVIYPGGLVDARAYAPIARAIAERGYFVSIVTVPLDFAIFAPDRAADVIGAHPEIRNWVVGGHSLGGVAASTFARQHPNAIAGLVLWASYPADSDDLSRSGLAVVSISGSNDGLSTPAKIAATRRLLPPDTRFVVIDGGNHAQFGRYGRQRGDLPATIEPTEQQERVATATVDFLRALSARP